MLPLIRKIRDAQEEHLSFTVVVESLLADINSQKQITSESLNGVLDRIDHFINSSTITDGTKNNIARSLAAMAMIKKNQNHSGCGPKLKDLYSKCSADVSNDLENIAPGSMRLLKPVVDELRADLESNRSKVRNLISDLRNFNLDDNK